MSSPSTESGHAIRPCTRAPPFGQNEGASKNAVNPALTRAPLTWCGLPAVLVARAPLRQKLMHAHQSPKARETEFHATYPPKIRANSDDDGRCRRHTIMTCVTFNTPLVGSEAVQALAALRALLPLGPLPTPCAVTRGWNIS